MRSLRRLPMISGICLLLAGIGALTAQAAPSFVPAVQPRPTLTPDRPTQPPAPTNTREPQPDDDDDPTPTATAEPTATLAPATTTEPTAAPTVEPTPTLAPPASLPRTGNPTDVGAWLAALGAMLLLVGAGLWRGLKRKT
jgi:hypothetical protein